MKSTNTDMRVLVVDDEQRIRTILAAVLKDENFEVATAEDGAEAVKFVGDFKPQVMIVDLQMPKMNGLETIEKVAQMDKSIVPIVLTAHGSIQSAVQATKHGVYDYLTKPFDNEQMILVVNRAMEHYRLAAEVDELKEKLGTKYGLSAIVGDSNVMRKLRADIGRIALTDATVLIEGESGTGKELAARAIHQESARRDRPFVVVDCGSVPLGIIESEFFGHERGAFTDAREARIGVFEEADSGSIFLDEIGELPMDAQTKLLRVIQEKEFTRVGGTSPVRVDVRVVAATNRNLEALVKQGKFREDLFYRLNVLRLRVPRLRDHIEDVPLYVKHFIKKHKETIGRGKREISAQALKFLKSYDWPGNIRELENAVQRAMLETSSDKIEESNFAFLTGRDTGFNFEYDGKVGLQEYVRRVLENTEKPLLLRYLIESDWNKVTAARKLKIDRKTLDYRMNRYGIKREVDR